MVAAPVSAFTGRPVRGLAMSAVFVLDEIDKLGAEPAAVLLEVLDPAQHHRFRDAFVELPFDLSEVLFITTANEPDRILPALRDRLEVIHLPGYAEAEKVAIARTHLIDAQKRAAGLEATPLRFTDGACRRIIRDYTSEQGVRQLTRCLQAICRKVALGLETGDAALVPDRITAAQVRTFLGEPDAAHADGLGRLRQRLEDPALPRPVRVRGRRVLAQLSARAPTDPEHQRAREYLDCLASLPWTARAEAPLDLARAHAVLDAGHAGHEAVKQRLLDQLAVRLSNPGAGFPAICLSGPPGVGKSALARLVAAALRRPCAWAPAAALANAAAVHGARSGPPGRIVEELRRTGVRNPVFVLDEVDRLDEAGGAAAALLEALDPAPSAAFRDRYLDVAFDLSEVLFIATATSIAAVPPMLRERIAPVELPGYTEDDKRVIATGHLLPLQLDRHGLSAEQVQVTGEAIAALIRGYTREAGVWGLAAALGAVCARLVRRRAEGDLAPAEVTAQTVAGMLGAPADPHLEVLGRSGQPGVAVGLCRTAAGGGEVIVVEAGRAPGTGALTLTGGQGPVMQESARTALSWLRANAARFGLDPDFHRHADVHLHVQAGDVPKEGASAGVTMAAALVSAFTDRPLRGGLAMTGELTLTGHLLPVGGIAAKLLAAHRAGIDRVVLPRRNRPDVEHLGDGLRRVVAVDYITRIDELLELALHRTPAADTLAAATPAGRVS